SIWGKVIGGVAGYALGGPLGGLMGAYAGHMMMDKNKARRGGRGGMFGGALGGGVFGAQPSVEDRQVAFTIAVIVLGAKMAKADGHVAREEIAAFKQVFRIPEGEAEAVGRLFNEARQDATGYEPYARQIAELFAHQPEVLEELLGGLFHIARAHGGINPAEMRVLTKVAAIFGFDRRNFERIAASFGAGGAPGRVETGPNPYEVLGVGPQATDAEVKRTYRDLIRKYHPDALMAQGMPQEFIDVANEKMAAINAAYDRIEKERGLK
ncbi:MAG: TerB family tellurite resistance protein, partial [Rhodospirillales bacterium]|nr:TerB family tellurite resistance protein [Rhodospirillales bacterium]